MTREEALNILHNASVYHPDYLDALNMAIQALEQEPILDKIRVELLAISEYDYIPTRNAMEIIDKYRTESEK